MSTTVKARKPVGIGIRLAVVLALWVGAVPFFAWAQTDCADGNGVLDTAPPKNMTPQELIQKFTAEETKVRDARLHYTYTQDVMVQTLDGKSVDGQFHEITNVSYDAKGKRLENVTFAEVSTLRNLSLTAQDMDDIRVFMPWILTADLVPQYKLTYAGQQHVDDLDTYVFHVEPLKEEKDRRYFQGRVWVDNRDLQVVKLCGKSVPEQVKVKKHQPVDVRPTFVGYRQLVDGYWFPTYARVDDTLHLGAQSTHVREVVKFKDYKRASPPGAALKP
ncbi:MAG TPA: hypothetical protein VE377_16465 [Candidatus Dormibacteraeota bacterium]|nr:hypothetical protein [Candidatus Dormibacteraeota bacterium]